MITGKDLKMFASVIPDDAGVTINGNWNVNIVNVKVETNPGGLLADLQLTPGYSITKDSVLEEMFKQKTSFPDAEVR